MDNSVRKLAVLIDAENASDRIAAGLFKQIAQLGEASVRRIYGDFSGTRLRGWTDILPRYGIIPQQQFANTVGKNASDIALVIDAMDLLHSGRFDGFCLVSSDSDFTRLAARIREQGLDIYGFGEQKTPESFQRACHRFIYTEPLREPPVQTLAAPAVKTPKDAVPLLQRALSQVKSDQGWISLGVLGNRLATMAPNFDPKTYGVSKLSNLVKQTSLFEVKTASNGQTRIRSL